MTQHSKGLLFTLTGVILMSVESPLIQISGLSAQNVGFFFGISLMLATNIMLISQGKEFFIKSYKTQTKGLILSGLFMGLSNYFFRGSLWVFYFFPRYPRCSSYRFFLLIGLFNRLFRAVGVNDWHFFLF